MCWCFFLRSRVQKLRKLFSPLSKSKTPVPNGATQALTPRPAPALPGRQSKLQMWRGVEVWKGHWDGALMFKHLNDFMKTYVLFKDYTYLFTITYLPGFFHLLDLNLSHGFHCFSSYY